MYNTILDEKSDCHLGPVERDTCECQEGTEN